MIAFRLCSGARSPTWSRVLAVIAMSLFLTLSATVCAYAEEGFLGGLQTLVDPDSAREIEDDPVRDYEYEPELRDGSVGENDLPEEGNEIQSVISAVNKNPFQNQGAYGNTLLGGIRQLTSGTNGALWVVPAVGIVFMWWGVRKAIRMLFAAFRSGRMTVGGYDVNPNSYYFGTRAKDWR